MLPSFYDQAEEDRCENQEGANAKPVEEDQTNETSVKTISYRARPGETSFLPSPRPDNVCPEGLGIVYEQSSVSHFKLF
jgi:hypothetical protein